MALPDIDVNAPGESGQMLLFEYMTMGWDTAWSVF
jgi:hypothetical protein